MHKYVPLLCSTPVVESLKAKRKTKTRRTKGLDLVNGDTEFEFSRFHNGVAKFTEKYNAINEQYIKCPYGNVGDVLWVRENFCRIDYGAFLYAADFDKLQKGWKPSIHMPKAACRFFLKIKSITVERLNVISIEDAIAEGVEPLKAPYKNQFNCYFCDSIGHKRMEHICVDGGYSNPIASFMSLWESINGEDSWNTNPWVWVIEFEQIEKPAYFLNPTAIVKNRIEFTHEWVTSFGWISTIFKVEDFKEVHQLFKKDNNNVLFIAQNKNKARHILKGKYVKKHKK